MKRVVTFLCALILCLLSACGKQPTQPFSPELVDSLLASDAFSEPLEVLDPEIAPFLYQLDPQPDKLTGLRAHRSAGATCEEVALMTFETEDDAAAALPKLEHYLAAQLDSCRDYRPAQIPKLEHALLIQRSNTLLLVVADNWTAASELVK